MKIPNIRKLPSGSYTCQLRINGRSISITNKDRKKVEKEAYSIKLGFHKAKNNPQDLTIADAVNNYIVERTNLLSPATVREYRHILNTPLSNISNIKLNRITKAALQKWVNEYASSRSAKTVNNVYRLLSASLINAGVPKEDVMVYLPKNQKAKTYAPTEDDITKLIAVAQGTKMELPILLAAFGSLRRSEICALTKDDITPTGVYVTKALVYTESREWVVKPPKTQESYRHAQLPKEVIAKLNDVNGDKITTLTPTAITARFPHLLKKAGVPSFRFHDLRHYWVSVAHASGVPDYYIMRNGGWTTM